MKCERVSPYLAGYAGGDLQPETTSLVESHVETCATCRAESERHARVSTALATLGARDVEPPAYLAEAIIESVAGAREAHRRRLVPVPPVPPEIIRAIAENRDAIAQAAGAALVAAGAAYAVWRTLRALRARPASA